jgi:alkylhydroperoxidase family enzyme
MKDDGDSELDWHSAHTREAILGAKADTARAVRESVLQLAGAIALGDGVAARNVDLAPAVVDFVTAIVLRPTTADVDGLLRSGFTEDAVLEITLAAAFAAGEARLRSGLAALRSAS